MQINYKLVLIILISVALGSSIAIAVIFIPRNDDKPAEGEATEATEAVGVEEDGPRYLRKAPIFQMKDESELVQDQRELNISKSRYGKTVVPFRLPTARDLAENKFNNTDVQFSLLTPAGEGQMKYLLQVKDKQNMLMGIVEVGQWEVGIVPSSVERVVFFLPGGDLAKSNQPHRVEVVDYFPDKKSNVSKFVFKNNAWALDTDE